LVAASALGWGALSSGWYQVETEQQLRVGLLGAERCSQGACGVVPLERLGVDPNVGRLGILVAVAGALAALLLLATAALGLARRKSPRRLPRAAMALAVFAACAGLAFHLLAPFAEGMTVGLPAFVFFAGAALVAATSAILFGALSGPARD
jgi:hypothetical protein